MVPTWKRRKGRPRNSWMQQVTTGMREKEINNLEWIEGEELPNNNNNNNNNNNVLKDALNIKLNKFRKMCGIIRTTLNQKHTQRNTHEFLQNYVYSNLNV